MTNPFAQAFHQAPQPAAMTTAFPATQHTNNNPFVAQAKPPAPQQQVQAHPFQQQLQSIINTFHQTITSVLTTPSVSLQLYSQLHAMEWQVVDASYKLAENIRSPEKKEASVKEKKQVIEYLNGAHTTLQAVATQEMQRIDAEMQKLFASVQQDPYRQCVNIHNFYFSLYSYQAQAITQLTHAALTSVHTMRTNVVNVTA